VTTKAKYAVPYLRVSTDDKGQNPERQHDVIRPWAEREGVFLLKPVVDEGTSATKTNPFERPKFLEACEVAAKAGADAIVIETVDRLTRQGTAIFGWVQVELRARYGLGLYLADVPLVIQEQLGGEILAAAKAALGREAMRQHSARVRSGMATAAKAGKKFGRPPKELTDVELDMALRMRAEGKGAPSIALAVSRSRGALDVADVGARRRLSISANTVRKALKKYDAQKVSDGA